MSNLSARTPKPSWQRLNEARAALADLSRPAPNLPALARSAGISTFHFIRKFEALFGSTPRQYRIHARLDEAKRLLSTGSRSVTDVCFAVGMSSVGSFSDLFTRRFGVSPSAYRRECESHPPITNCFCLMAGAFRNFEEASGTRLP